MVGTIPLAWILSSVSRKGAEQPQYVHCSSDCRPNMTSLFMLLLHDFPTTLYLEL